MGLRRDRPWRYLHDDFEASGNVQLSLLDPSVHASDRGRSGLTRYPCLWRSTDTHDRHAARAVSTQDLGDAAPDRALPGPDRGIPVYQDRGHVWYGTRHAATPGQRRRGLFLDRDSQALGGPFV